MYRIISNSLSFSLMVFVVLAIHTPVFGQVVVGEREPIVLRGYLSCIGDDDDTHTCPFRLHYVNLDKGRTYYIRMESSEFPTRLTIEDMHGNVLIADDDDYAMLEGAIVFRPLTSGDYRLTASTREPMEGFYSITIREMTNLFAVNASLEAEEANEDVANERTYDVALTAGQRYVIDMRSPDFRAYLKLLDSDGVMVAFQDECGAMSTARLVFTPTITATYRIVATSYEPGRTGSFRVTASLE